MSNGSPMRRASLPAFPHPTRTRAPVPARTMRPMETSSELKHSPLEKEHAALGAKLGPFGGCLMTIEYAGALAEHRAARERVGLFALTHVGKVEVAGPGAFVVVQGVVTNDVSTVDVVERRGNLVLNEGGGV